MLSKFFSFLAFILICTPSFAKEFTGNIYKQIYAYEKEHAKFSKQVCSPGIDFKFYKLLKAYRGDGIYLPTIHHRIDRDAIKKNLKYIKAKLSYIKSIEKKLLKEKNLSPIEPLTSTILIQINELLLDKKKNSKSKPKLEKLEAAFDEIVERVYYLKSYKYPNDHLVNRVRYDSFLGLSDLKSLKMKNETYFYRKIIEDGSFDENNERSDIYLRSTLDTIKKTFQSNPEDLSENLRYDLEWVIDKVTDSNERSTAKQLARMKEWSSRVDNQLKYYRDIIKLSLKKEYAILKDRDLSSKELKEFVYTKQAEVFNYWHKKSDILKKMFSLETILFNEVGSIDGPDALERMDVVKIVLNRFKDKQYNLISKDQEIVKYLSDESWKKDTILGTLFKRGEFSFTYYYISSVVKIFCPDMTGIGKRLRSQNLKISLNLLRSYDYDFLASRYFSRVSMFGKVDMSKVWTDFSAFPERRGIIHSNQIRIYNLFKRNEHRLLYEFTDPEGEKYTVIEMYNRKYSVKNIDDVPVFFKYRSPHLFTYFIKK